MLLVGSRALELHHDVNRPVHDWDYIATYDEFRSWCASAPHITSCFPISGKKYVVTSNNWIYEFEIAWPDSVAEELLKMYTGIAPVEVLLALKMSHRYLRNSPHFLKTMNDIRLFRSLGYTVPDSLKDWLKKREAETYNYQHPILKQGKVGFFTDNVPYVYDHDTVHLAVKRFERPAYEYFKGDNQEVFCSKEKFFALPRQVQLSAVLEESYVLAIERSLVPHPNVLSPKQAFLKALMKVCTSITSGWFREFAWENYNIVVQEYNPEYWNEFQVGVKSGLVKELKWSQDQLS